MSQLPNRGLAPETVFRLKPSATVYGRSLEAHLRSILTESEDKVHAPVPTEKTNTGTRRRSSITKIPEYRPDLPVPDADLVRKTQELYRKDYGMEITSEEAFDIAGRIVRFLYLTSPLSRRSDDDPNSPELE